MPSFYSERTAEYSLIPKFLEILEPLGAAIPIFYSGNREDTSVAMSSLAEQHFHLIAFFARRPKIQSAGSLRIEGKINGRLFRVARFASQLGVPVFSGISLTNNVFDQVSSQSLWFDISEFHDEEDVIFTCEMNEARRLTNFEGFIEPASDSEILSQVSRSRVFSWAQVTHIMSELPKMSAYPSSSNYRFFSQAWRMKPVYIAIKKP